MYWPMARRARRRIRISGLQRAPVNALRKLIHFGGMAFGALHGQRFRRWRYFMRVAVARQASCLAEHRVNTFRSMCNLFRVARCALYAGDPGRVRKIIDARVAVTAAQNSMHTHGMFFRADGDSSSFFRLHPRLAMAGEAWCVLFQGLGLCFWAPVARSARGTSQ